MTQFYKRVYYSIGILVAHCIATEFYFQKERNDTGFV